MKVLESKNLKRLTILMLLVVINIVVFTVTNVDLKGNMTLQYTVKADTTDNYQMFYSSGDTWSEECSVWENYTETNTEQVIEYKIPQSTNRIRIDLGEKAGKIRISNIFIKRLGCKLDLSNVVFSEAEEYSNISAIIQEEGSLIITRETNDAFIVIDFSKVDMDSLFTLNKIVNYGFKILACLVSTLILFILVKKGSTIKNLCKELKSNRMLIWNLAKNDFKTKYAGSYLGVIWAFVQPIVTVLVYWFVFQVGFRSAPIEDFPYALWLVSGLVPWFFFSDAILNATNSMLEYSYLVKKVVFKISILPIVKIISALFVHLFFIAFTLVLFMLYGYMPDLYTIQIIYYTLCIFAFVLALSYATCSIVIFFRDFGQIINILLQVGVWMTPIMWVYTMVPESTRWIFKINPMYYIVEGYRDSLINKVWFWERFNQTLYFWLLTGTIFICGTIIFKRLKVHFADVL